MKIQLSKKCQHIYPASLVFGRIVLKPCRNCEHVADTETHEHRSTGYDLLAQAILRPAQARTPRHLRAVQ